jgi:hypothetical protein
MTIAQLMHNWQPESLFEFAFEYNQSFSETMTKCFIMLTQANWQYSPLLADDVAYKVIQDNAEF